MTYVLLSISIDSTNNMKAVKIVLLLYSRQNIEEIAQGTFGMPVRYVVDLRKVCVLRSLLLISNSIKTTG